MDLTHFGACGAWWGVTAHEGFSGDLTAHWCDCLDKFFLRVACNFNFKLAKGGNKDQLWFSSKKNKLYGGKRWCSPEKEAIRWL